MDNGANSYLRFLQGDNEGFVELVREYEDGLILFINSFVNDYHTAEEAADEVFLKLYTDKPKFRGKSSFKTWLYAIGRNTALNLVRKNKAGHFAPIEDYFYLSDDIDIEEKVIMDEEKMSLHRAVKGLKAEYAQALYLIFFEGMSNPEVARIMGKTDKQIAVIIHRAKKALRAKLEREDGNG